MLKYYLQILCFLFSSTLMASCSLTHAVYGVPEDQWNRMTEKERQLTRERFYQQEKINAQTRVQAEKARQEAEEFANRCQKDKETSSAPQECHVTTKRQWGL